MQINLNVLEKVRKISGMERSTRVINSYKLAPYGTVWHRMAPYGTIWHHKSNTRVKINKNKYLQKITN